MNTQVQNKPYFVLSIPRLEKHSVWPEPFLGLLDHMSLQSHQALHSAFLTKDSLLTLLQQSQWWRKEVNDYFLGVCLWVWNGNSKRMIKEPPFGEWEKSRYTGTTKSSSMLASQKRVNQLIVSIFCLRKYKRQSDEFFIHRELLMLGLWSLAPTETCSQAATTHSLVEIQAL